MSRAAVQVRIQELNSELAARVEPVLLRFAQRCRSRSNISITATRQWGVPRMRDHEPQFCVGLVFLQDGSTLPRFTAMADFAWEGGDDEGVLYCAYSAALPSTLPTTIRGTFANCLTKALHGMMNSGSHR